MATITPTASGNVDSLAWNANDTLVINNGYTITVNTDQKKFWNIITINNGKLRIENTSTATAIRFTMGRSSGATAPAITPANGLGSIEIADNWIQIGTGTGAAGQTFTVPYTDHVPMVEVETGAGTGIYEPYVNVTLGYGGQHPDQLYSKFNGFRTGAKGRCFIQTPAANPDQYIVLTNCSTTSGSKTVGVSSSAGIFVGASIIGSTNIPASSVVQRIIDGTSIEINQNATATGSTVTATIHNPFASQLTNEIVFGDGVHGNVVPTGAKVRIPNIMITSVMGANLASLTYSGVNINLTNGGSMDASICLFDHVQSTFTQAQVLRLHDVGFSYPHTIQKIYGCDLDGVAVSCAPQRYVLDGTRYRVAQYHSNSVLNFIYVAGSFLRLISYQQSGFSNTSTADVYGVFRFAYCDGITIDNVVIVVSRYFTSLQNPALLLYYVNRATVGALELHHPVPLRLVASSENIIDGVEYSLVGPDDVSTGSMVSAGSSNYMVDPATEAEFVDGTVYYYKERYFGDWLGQSYHDSREYAFVPHLSSATMWDYLQYSMPTAGGSVTFTWTQRAPTYTAPAYEIFRDTLSTVPVRDASTRVFTTNSASDVTSGVITHANGTTYYYVLRKHSASGSYEDSPIIEITPSAIAYPKNYALQSSVYTNAQWVKSNVTTPTASIRCVPSGASFGYEASDQTAAYSTVANGTLTNTVTGLTIGNWYTASIWVNFLGYYVVATAKETTTPMRLTFGTAFQDFNATESWQRISVPFQATATSHTVVVQLNTVNRCVCLGNCMVNDGATALMDVATTTTAATLTLEPTAVTMVSRGLGGATKNGGVYFNRPTHVVGQRVTEAYISTTKGFTPSAANRVHLNTSYLNQCQIYTTSSRNTIRNVSQRGAGANHTASVIFSGSCSDNVLENWTLDLAGNNTMATNAYGLFDIKLDSNRNKLKNIAFKNHRPYHYHSVPLSLDNTANGTLIENLRFDTSDSYAMALNNDMIIKGMAGGNASAPAGSVLTWDMGSTVDGVPTTFTGVFDTHFAEFYHTATTGALNVFFCASTKASPPYTLTGSAVFSNTGLLYLQNAGDSITYTWPHKIYGVSGFRNVLHKVYQNDLAYNNTSGQGRELLQALLIEYQIDSGSGFNAWAEATPAALNALTLSASAGFYLKLRLTARQFLIYTGETIPFAVNDVIRQQTSGATARVTAVYDMGTTGVLCLDTVTGTWTATTTLDILRDSDSAVMATGITLINGFALGPSFNSYIRGLQIHTVVDQTVMYPSELVTLTVNGLIAGSIFVVYDGDSADPQSLGTQLFRNDSSGTSGSFIYEASKAGDNVVIEMIADGYKIYQDTVTLGASAASYTVKPVQETN